MWITDRNDSTCNRDIDLQSVNVTWNSTYPFSWLRLTVKDNAYPGNFTVSCRTSGNNEIDCNNQTIYVKDAKTVDITCQMTVDVIQVIIRGHSVNSLCSLYISGGRNEALNQPVAQSSTYVADGDDLGLAVHAVDGDTSSVFKSKTCTHTQKSISPSWNVTFRQPHAINRIVLYNRFDDTASKCCPERLIHFGLQTLNASNKILFSFRDPGNTSMLIYTVVVPVSQRTLPINGIIVNSSTDILTLCEVLAFEECASGTWGLDCNNPCNPSCRTSCHVETGFCQTCNGFSNPPTCDIECESGKWGLNCTQNCSGNCYNQSCDRQTGVCDKGCNGYSDSPACTKPCPPTTWGLNCKSNCSTNCSESSCDKQSGKCDKGCSGYSDPPNCNTECNSTQWGPNCSNSCNNSCYMSKCDRLNGICTQGCDGYNNPPNCTIECTPGTWGKNCKSMCSNHCSNTSCDRHSGECDQGCNGYDDFPDCNKTCPPTTWGINCTRNCSENCSESSCDKQSGECDKGCNGYSDPPTCNTDCDDGYWGLNCTVPCSFHCFNKTCHGQTSECRNGCNAGYLPPKCEQGCSEHFYGVNCSETCSSNCTNGTCDSLRGSCSSCIIDHKGPFCEVIIVAQTNNDTPVGAIVGPIFAAIIICAVIIAGVILWRRHATHNKSKHTPEGDKRLSQLDQINFNELEDNYSESNHQIKNTRLSKNEGIYNNAGTYNNVQITSIAVKDLNTFMHAQNKTYFQHQFENIPAPLNVTTEVGTNSSNKHKNRYKNIVPYDHSRVHLEINTLKKEEDYINACYIEGFNKDDKFIASQGPNKIILNDFVRMLWEQQVDKVVMLTNLIEEGTVKCEKYWLDDSPAQFGEIQVRMIAIQTFADYVIRVLEISKPRETVAVQTFTHFHFTSWPDKGVPVSPWGLVDFEQRVFAHPTSRPIVVHCSAGVGRTGTFIALHNVIREAAQTGYVDFFKTVVKLRQDRILMIQTMEQYLFLHKAAQIAIVCIRTTVTSNDIVGRIKQLEQKSLRGITKMEAEFRDVSNVNDDFKEDFNKAEEYSGEDGNVYQNSEETMDKVKNRFSNITPNPKYRPVLACGTTDMRDYINAVFLPGFKKQSQHLITQLPMPTTVVDFWRLVTQYNVSLIVAFEVHTMVTDNTFGKYLPKAANEELIFSPYKIKSMSLTKAALWEEQVLMVVTEKRKSLLSLSQNNNESQTVIHLKCLFTELNPDKLLSFLRQIRSYNALAQGRIVYTCSNGAKYSGLACVLSLLLDRMEHDSCLTVPLVVGTVKTIRPEVIPNLDQYRVLYDVLGTYSDNSVTYDNIGKVAQNGAFVSTASGDSSFSEDQTANVYANF
ncbi:unnamed protein product [Lymnaea stagnalis]|uniref:protein-tyrosine-phosphatase n=1 Tax=Lymnaea stagnalis TaxID=6523 RepID=A0AAV2HL40_LYMST